ncbi:unnamed protein product [Penicillium olsonii]|uniref:Uncharacterized protein n=1 Tax=Penicillium olsonii TaxID=99116 RepID=A0A9W4HJ28_PENOL|nr:unnamed protein product [Penicillium olsonii]CAG8120458.1 unnamed protein product [Penicillium olsonii]
MASSRLLGCMILQLSLFYFISLVSATSQCFYPNGDKSTDTPCYTDGSASHCCGSRSICLTNKLCLSVEQPYQLSRGSCTDNDWRSGSCPLNTCREFQSPKLLTKADPKFAESAQPGAGAAVVWLNGTGADSVYCCNSVLVNQTSSEKFCSNINGSPQSSFAVADGYIIPGAAALSELVKGSNDTSSVVANNTSTATPSSSPTIKESNDLAIGAGVGVPLGIIAIFSIGWALWERRKRKRAVLQSSRPVQPVIAHDRSFMLNELGADHPKMPELYSRSSRV